MSMYRKSKIENSLAINIFLGSNMDFCKADLTSEGVDKFIIVKNILRILWPKICSIGQIWTTVWMI